MSEKRRNLIILVLFTFWVIAWCYFVLDNEGKTHNAWLLLFGIFTLKGVTDAAIALMARPRSVTREQFAEATARLEAIEQLLRDLKPTPTAPAPAAPADWPLAPVVRADDADTIPLKRAEVNNALTAPTAYLPIAPRPAELNGPYRAVAKAPGDTTQGAPVTVAAPDRKAGRPRRGGRGRPSPDDVVEPDIAELIDLGLRNFIAGIQVDTPRPAAPPADEDDIDDD